SKLVRKVPVSPCKRDEAENLWHDANAQASAKCKDFVARNYDHLVGGGAVPGTKTLLVLLRGPRLGELAVIDAKTLAERKTIKMPWCDAAAEGEKAGAGPAPGAERGSRYDADRGP